jgi:hypothetical protein
MKSWMIALAALGTWGTLQGQDEGGSADVTPPPMPWRSEAAIKAWVEQTVTEAPPEGGVVTMLTHWAPKYYSKEISKIGEVWIVPGLDKVVINGKTEYEQDFCVFHVDTGESTLEVALKISESELKKYLSEAK